MWMVLTSTNGKQVLVDFAKATDVQSVASGTKICFTPVAHDKSGQHNARNVVVQEPVAKIARALKAKAV